MSSSFFLKKDPKVNKKRKLQTGATGGARGSAKGRNRKNTPTGPPPKKRPQKNDEEIASDDEDIESGEQSERKAPHLEFSSDDGEEESVQDKRLRLAKKYLEEIERQEADRADDRDLHDHVAKRLQSEYLDSVGRLRRNIAASIEGYDAEHLTTLKHKQQHLPVCSMALTADGKFLFSGAKTRFVLKWNLETLKPEGAFDVQPHTDDPDDGKKRRTNVIAMCLSSDSKFLALAEGGKNIQIWCPKGLKHLKTFKGHRDVVTGLVFRKDTHDLYSCSRDRSVKIWSLDEMTYVESLFGHQAGITSIDALSRERAISSGGIDCSLRIWKITEESQLIYNGHIGSIECVKFINEENFISGGDDGSLSLWSALKKKALCTYPLVHGRQSNGTANWISAIACVVNTDLVASGSCDGYIRLWRTLNNMRKLEQIQQIPMPGFVNSLAFNSDGSKLIAAVGQEHRLGRWWRIKETKNKIVVIDLVRSSAKTDS